MIKNEELLRAHAPAAFAEAPEDGQVSSRYSFLPTTDILEILQDEGWTTWKAQQVNPRKWSRDHAKHIIRLKNLLGLETPSLRCFLLMPTTVLGAIRFRVESFA